MGERGWVKELKFLLSARTTSLPLVSHDFQVPEMNLSFETPARFRVGIRFRLLSFLPNSSERERILGFYCRTLANLSARLSFFYRFWTSPDAHPSLMKL